MNIDSKNISNIDNSMFDLLIESKQTQSKAQIYLNEKEDNSLINKLIERNWGNKLKNDQNNKDFEFGCKQCKIY